MKKTLSLILVALFLLACGGPEKPKKLLSPEEMENIMYDMSLLQAIRSFSPQKLSDNGVDPQQYIFKKYSIDSLTLAQNNMYYAQDLKAYKKIQQNVTNRLKAEREKITGKNNTQAKPTPAGLQPQNTTDSGAASDNAEKRKKDSLRDIGKKRLHRVPAITKPAN